MSNWRPKEDEYLKQSLIHLLYLLHSFEKDNIMNIMLHILGHKYLPMVFSWYNKSQEMILYTWTLITCLGLKAADISPDKGTCSKYVDNNIPSEDSNIMPGVYISSSCLIKKA